MIIDLDNMAKDDREDKSETRRMLTELANASENAIAFHEYSEETARDEVNVNAEESAK